MTYFFLQTNRFINIDFACLEATINLQTWVVLLDFLGMGAKVHDPSVTDPQSKIHITDTTNVLKKGKNMTCININIYHRNIVHCF